MSSFDQEIDIARNLKTVEWLKTELVSSVANLFKALVRGQEEPILESLSNTIVATYLLGKRVGINFSKVDSKVENIIRMNIQEEHEVEKWYGDLSNLLHYLKK